MDLEIPYSKLGQYLGAEKHWVHEMNNKNNTMKDKPPETGLAF